jgi:phosphate transport system permease protein
MMPEAMKQTTVALPPPRRRGDVVFKWLTWLMALTVVALIILVGWKLFQGSQLSLHRFGAKFLVTSTWDPVHGQFGVLPQIFGTLYSSLIALLIAVPLGIGAAVYLTELAPMRLRQPIVSVIEMLAAVPSVIFGLWGIFVLIPWLQTWLVPLLRKTLGFLPFFQGPFSGNSFLAAGIILAIMILPIITSVSREILRSVPNLQREAAYALGATRWEVTRIAVLSYAKRGLFGAVVLGLGRALGETMAVTMVIGNSPKIGLSVFAPGDTLASLIANQFMEAVKHLYHSALIEVGLVLFGVTILVNTLAQLLIASTTGPKTSRAVQ